MDDLIIHKIIKGTGTPFFLLNMPKVQHNYNNFYQSFQTKYSSFNIAYSFKTNYIPQICAYVKKAGGIAEVVSEMELDLALKLGFTGDRIIFNGPGKSVSALKKALLNEVIINLDSSYEIHVLIDLISELKINQAKVGIRFNLRLEDDDTQSRFGIDYNSDDFQDILSLISKSSNIKLTCLHTHLMASIRSTDVYAKIAEQMADIYNDLTPQIDIKYLDLGGGFYSEMKVEYKKQFGYYIPTIAEYSEVITQVLNRKLRDRKPMLLLEPGLAIVADVIDVYARVMDIKKVRNNTFAYLNISKYDIKPTGHNKNLPIKVLPQKGNIRAFYNNLLFTGNTCMEDDILFRGYQGKLGIGDMIKFENIGAYTIVLRPNFIHPMPPVVMISGDGGISTIKKRESAEDVFQQYSR